MTTNERDNVTVAIEGLIDDLIRLLKEEHGGLEKRGYGRQNISDFFVNKLIKLPSNIVLPIDQVEYRVLYDHYESLLLQNFITLIERALEEKNSIFVTFSFRTMQEMGINLMDALFAPDLVPEDKKYIKLFAILMDFAAMPDPRHNKYFKQLFKAEGAQLLLRDKQLFENLINFRDEEKKVLLDREIRKARKRFNSLLADKLQDIEPLPILRKQNVIQVRSWWSHLLHGNPFLIQDTFKPEKKWRLNFRIYAMILTSGLNAANRLALHLDDQSLSEKTRQLNNRMDNLWPKVSALWKQRMI